MNASIIKKEEIEKTNATRLSDIINEELGLITVSDFGGAEGIQMQGLDSEYTLILIDNQPLVGRLAGGTGAMTGDYNVFVGTGIGGNNGLTSAYQNVVIGREAAYFGTSFNTSVLIGHAAGKSMTNGAEIVAIPFEITTEIPS